MIGFRKKRLVLQTAFLLLIAAGLSGCSRDGNVVSDTGDNSAGQQKSQSMGRYVESEVALPNGVTYDSVVSFQNGPDGLPVLFTRKDKNGLAEFTGYLLSEDLTWKEKECSWLNRLGLSYEKVNIGISYGEDHKLYAVYSEEEDPELIARHYAVVTEDWENSREIQIPLLTETCDMGYSYYPRKITSLKNGNLLFDSGNSIFLFDAEGQRKIAEILNSAGNYFAHNNQFYIIDGDSGNLVLYDGESGKETARYPLEIEQLYTAIAIAGGDDELSLMSKDGIQILKKDSDIWEQIVEGDRNTMASPKYYPFGFAKAGWGDYFVYYNSMDETCRFARYSFDSDMPAEPETELTVFSLRDNYTIRQAVSVFQIENPNVRIDFQPVMGDGDGSVADDYIRTLSTELLAGEGPDILILDGLPEPSYIEKGILEDVTEEIEALVSSGDYLENIADGCRVDKRIYSVPVRIGLPVTFGRKAVLNEAQQLNTLADLVRSQPVGQVFGTLDRDAMVSLYTDAFLHNIVNEKGMIDERELNDFLVSMKVILDGSVISDGSGEKRPSSIWGLLEHGTFLNSQEVAGFFEAGPGTSVVKQAQGELEAGMIGINRTYIPYGTIGINKAGKNKETAIAFLRTALSQEIQNSDFYDGFTVNGNALEYFCETERVSADAYGGLISGIDGRTYEFKSSWPDELQRRKLAEFVKEADHSAGRNWKIKQILVDYSKSYFDGTQSLEDVTNELMTKITLYMQE